MKKIPLSLAAALIMVAGFATSADAQRVRGGAGFYRGGGGALCRRPRWRIWCRGPGIPARPALSAVPACGAAAVGSAVRRWGGAPRRLVGAGLIGRRIGGRGLLRRLTPATAVYGYGGGCRAWQMVGTPWGPQWQLVNVCYAPVGLWLRSSRLLRRRRLLNVTPHRPPRATRRALPGGFFKSISRPLPSALHGPAQHPVT